VKWNNILGVIGSAAAIAGIALLVGCFPRIIIAGQ
jgi:hypothetical protein